MRKVFILLKQRDIGKTKQILTNVHEPYTSIQCVNKSNILWHMMTVDHSTTCAVNDRVNIANGAWGLYETLP